MCKRMRFFFRVCVCVCLCIFPHFICASHFCDENFFLLVAKTFPNEVMTNKVKLRTTWHLKLAISIHCIDSEIRFFWMVRAKLSWIKGLTRHLKSCLPSNRKIFPIQHIFNRNHFIQQWLLFRCRCRRHCHCWHRRLCWLMPMHSMQTKFVKDKYFMQILSVAYVSISANRTLCTRTVQCIHLI